jgi:hypothetical protein
MCRDSEKAAGEEAMQDGIGQQGAGTSDMRQGGRDVQHARQYSSQGTNKAVYGGFTQQDLHEALMEEQGRHRQSKEARLSDLKKHYER